MGDFLKALVSHGGLLGAYPFWYQLLACSWLLATAVLLGGFLIISPIKEMVEAQLPLPTDGSKKNSPTKPVLNEPSQQYLPILEGKLITIGPVSADPSVRDSLRAQRKLRPLLETENQVELARMPNGTYGFSMGNFPDFHAVYREKSQNLIEVQRTLDGTVNYVAYASEEAAASLAAFNDAVLKTSKTVMIYVEPWEQAQRLVTIPRLHITAMNKYGFRQTSRFEIVMVKK